MKRVDEVAKMLIILPKLMSHIRMGFKPSLGVRIKKNEFKTLKELNLNPGKPMKHYVSAVDMESGSFTYLANKLEEKGLIRRVTEQNDKRKTALELTEKGAHIMAELDVQFRAHIVRKIACLDTQELKELSHATDILENILKKLEKDT